MTPKIQELANKALGTRKHRPPVWQFYDVELQQFAELVIQECADWIRINYNSEVAEPLAFTLERDFGLHGDY